MPKKYGYGKSAQAKIMKKAGIKKKPAKKKKR